MIRSDQQSDYKARETTHATFLVNTHTKTRAMHSPMHCAFSRRIPPRCAATSFVLDVPAADAPQHGELRLFNHAKRSLPREKG